MHEIYRLLKDRAINNMSLEEIEIEEKEAWLNELLNDNFELKNGKQQSGRN